MNIKPNTISDASAAKAAAVQAIVENAQQTKMVAPSNYIAESASDNSNILKLLIGAAAIGGVYFAWKKSKRQSTGLGEFGDAVSNELIEQVGKLAEDGRCEEAIDKSFKVRGLVGTAAERGLYKLQLMHLNRKCKKQLNNHLSTAEAMREEIGERFTSLVKNDQFKTTGKHGRKFKPQLDNLKKAIRKLNKAVVNKEPAAELQYLQRQVEQARAAAISGKRDESLIEQIELLDAVYEETKKAGHRRSSSMDPRKPGSLINKIRAKYRSGEPVPFKRKTRSDKGAKKK